MMALHATERTPSSSSNNNNNHNNTELQEIFTDSFTQLFKSSSPDKRPLPVTKSLVSSDNANDKPDAEAALENAKEQLKIMQAKLDEHKQACIHQLHLAKQEAVYSYSYLSSMRICLENSSTATVDPETYLRAVFDDKQLDVGHLVDCLIQNVLIWLPADARMYTNTTTGLQNAGISSQLKDSLFILICLTRDSSSRNDHDVSVHIVANHDAFVQRVMLFLHWPVLTDQTQQQQQLSAGASPVLMQVAEMQVELLTILHHILLNKRCMLMLLMNTTNIATHKSTASIKRKSSSSTHNSGTRFLGRFVQLCTRFIFRSSCVRAVEVCLASLAALALHLDAEFYRQKAAAAIASAVSDDDIEIQLDAEARENATNKRVAPASTPYFQSIANIRMQFRLAVTHSLSLVNLHRLFDQWQHNNAVRSALILLCNVLGIARPLELLVCVRQDQNNDPDSEQWEQYAFDNDDNDLVFELQDAELEPLFYDLLTTPAECCLIPAATAAPPPQPQPAFVENNIVQFSHHNNNTVPRRHSNHYTHDDADKKKNTHSAPPAIAQVVPVVTEPNIVAAVKPTSTSTTASKADSVPNAAAAAATASILNTAPHTALHPSATASTSNTSATVAVPHVAAAAAAPPNNITNESARKRLFYDDDDEDVYDEDEEIQHHMCSAAVDNKKLLLDNNAAAVLIEDVQFDAEQQPQIDPNELPAAIDDSSKNAGYRGLVYRKPLEREIMTSRSPADANTSISFKNGGGGAGTQRHHLKSQDIRNYFMQPQDNLLNAVLQRNAMEANANSSPSNTPVEMASHAATAGGTMQPQQQQHFSPRPAAAGVIAKQYGGAVVAGSNKRGGYVDRFIRGKRRNGGGGGGRPPLKQPSPVHIRVAPAITGTNRVAAANINNNAAGAAAGAELPVYDYYDDDDGDEEMQGDIHEQRDDIVIEEGGGDNEEEEDVYEIVAPMRAAAAAVAAYDHQSNMGKIVVSNGRGDPAYVTRTFLPTTDIVAPTKAGPPTPALREQQQLPITHNTTRLTTPASIGRWPTSTHAASDAYKINNNLMQINNVGSPVVALAGDVSFDMAEFSTQNALRTMSAAAAAAPSNTSMTTTTQGRAQLMLDDFASNFSTQESSSPGSGLNAAAAAARNFGGAVRSAALPAIRPLGSYLPRRAAAASKAFGGAAAGEEAAVQKPLGPIPVDYVVDTVNAVDEDDVAENNYHQAANRLASPHLLPRRPPPAQALMNSNNSNDDAGGDDAVQVLLQTFKTQDTLRKVDAAARNASGPAQMQAAARFAPPSPAAAAASLSRGGGRS